VHLQLAVDLRPALVAGLAERGLVGDDSDGRYCEHRNTTGPNPGQEPTKSRRVRTQTEPPFVGLRG
jgi:hypothetical protein